MKLTIELDRETDGRWIAEVPELNVLLYGESRQDAFQRCKQQRKRLFATRSPKESLLRWLERRRSISLQESVVIELN